MPEVLQSLKAASRTTVTPQRLGRVFQGALHLRLLGRVEGSVEGWVDLTANS